jgi:formyl-CoA transferase
MAAITGALDDVVVLDLTQMLAGPFVTMMLADQGARVIKVEPPGGDTTRLFGPFLAGQTTVPDGGYGGYFGSTNRNKQSIVIDLKSDAGRETLKRLVAKVDILVENFRAGVMERLGLGYETLAEINPRLVYGTIRGFGDPRTGRSPYASWPAYDIVAQAMGGIIAITSPTRAVHRQRLAPASAISFRRCNARSASSRRCIGHAPRAAASSSTSPWSTACAACERPVFQYSYDGNAPGPEGNSHPLLCPYGLFPAKDGWVAIGCPHDEFWRLLVRTIGRPELAEDKRYTFTRDRLDRREEVEGVVTAWTSARTKSEITEVLGGKIPFGPVRGIDEVFDDPHTQARGMLAEVELPGITDRRVQVANTAVKLSDTPGGVRTRAPLTGEHTARVLTDFGFDAAEIDRLRAERVIV